MRPDSYGALRPSRELHLWLGLLTGVVLVVVSVTGIVLNHTARLNLGSEGPPEQRGSGTLADVQPIHELLKAALREAVRRDVKIVNARGRVRAAAGPSAIDRAVFHPANRTVQVRLRDPVHTEIVLDWSTAAVLSVSRRHLAWIEHLHSGEALGPLGVVVSDVLAVALVVVVVTGLVLWIRRSGRGAARTAGETPRGWMAANRSFHRIGGLVVTLFAIVLCVTGVLLNHKREWGLMVEPVRMVNEDFVARLNPSSLDSIVRSAVETARGRLPDATADDVVIVDYRLASGYAKVRFEQADTEVIVDASDRKALSFSRRHDRWIEALHSGMLFGSQGSLLSDVSAVLLILLTVNGVYLWVKPAWTGRGRPATSPRTRDLILVQAHVSGLLFAGAALLLPVAWPLARGTSWDARRAPMLAAVALSLVAGVGPWLWRQTVRGQRHLISALVLLVAGSLVMLVPVVDLRAVFGCQAAVTAAVLAEVGTRRRAITWFWACTACLVAGAVLFALLVEPRPVLD